MSEKFEEKNGEKLLKLAEMLNELGPGRGSLIPILQKAQEIFGYLPREVILKIGERTGISISKIYGVVTFYSQFHLKPRGRNIIRSCQGTACHVRGAGEVMAKIAEKLGLADGETTTADLEYTLESVACIGCCGLAPVITINDDTHGRLTPEAVDKILETAAAR